MTTTWATIPPAYREGWARDVAILRGRGLAPGQIAAQLGTTLGTVLRIMGDA